MIQSKDDLIEYLLKDKEALGRKYKRPHFGRDEIWRFQIALRKHEYYANTKKNKFLEKYWAWQHHSFLKEGVTIAGVPAKVIGERKSGLV